MQRAVTRIQKFIWPPGLVRSFLELLNGGYNTIKYRASYLRFLCPMSQCLLTAWTGQYWLAADCTRSLGRASRRCLGRNAPPYMLSGGGGSELASEGPCNRYSCKTILLSLR